MTAILAAAVLAGIAFALAVFRPQRAAELLIFSVPFAGVDADVGLRLTATQTIVIGMLAAVPFARRMGRFPVLWVAFIVYSIGISFLQLGNAPDLTVAGGAARNGSARVIGQCLNLILRLAPVFLLATFSRRDRAFSLGRAYVVACVVLASMAYLQWTTHLVAGYDPFPIGVVAKALGSPVITKSVTINVGGVSLLRVCALSGEPKGLGQFLAVGLVLVQYASLQRGFGQRRGMVWLYIAGAMLFTWSTSAFFMWPLMTLMQWALTWLSPRFRGVKEAGTTARAPSIVPGLVLAVVVGLVYLAPRKEESGGSRVASMLRQRTFGRAHAEDFDSVIFDFLATEPGYAVLGTGLGTVHLFAAKYVPRKHRHYMAGSVFVAKAGALRIVSETGFIGLLLFLGGVAEMLTRRQRELYRMNLPGTVQAISVIALISMLIRMYLEQVMMVACGGLLLADGAQPAEADDGTPEAESAPGAFPSTN